MKNLLVFAILSILVVQTYASGGNELGNGGDAILCPDNQILFYDVYEAEHRFSMQPQFPEAENEYEIAKKIVKRLSGLSPLRMKGYIDWIDQFDAETQFLTGKKLIDVPDTNSGFIPKGCSIEQLLIQREPKFPGEKRFVVNLDLWQNLSIEHRAAALVHEMLLREGRIHKHQNSENIRYLNAILLSDQLKTLTLQKWFHLLHETIQFQMSDVDGLWVITKTGPLPNCFGAANCSVFNEEGGMVIGGMPYIVDTVGSTPFDETTIQSLPWIQVVYRNSGIGFVDGKVAQLYANVTFANISWNLDLEMKSQQNGDIIAIAYGRNEGKPLEIRVKSGLIKTHVLSKLKRVFDKYELIPTRIFAPGLPEELDGDCGWTNYRVTYNDKAISNIKLNRDGEVLSVRYCK